MIPIPMLVVPASLAALAAIPLAIRWRRRKLRREALEMLADAMAEIGADRELMRRAARDAAKAVESGEMSMEDAVRMMLLPVYAAWVGRLGLRSTRAIIEFARLSYPENRSDPDTVVSVIVSAIHADGKPAVVARHGDINVVGTVLSHDDVRVIAFRLVNGKMRMVKDVDLVQRIVEKEGIVIEPSGYREPYREYMARLEVQSRPSMNIM